MLCSPAQAATRERQVRTDCGVRCGRAGSRDASRAIVRCAPDSTACNLDRLLLAHRRKRNGCILPSLVHAQVIEGMDGKWDLRMEIPLAQQVLTGASPTGRSVDDRQRPDCPRRVYQTTCTTVRTPGSGLAARKDGYAALIRRNHYHDGSFAPYVRAVSGSAAVSSLVRR